MWWQLNVYARVNCCRCCCLSHKRLQLKFIWLKILHVKSDHRQSHTHTHLAAQWIKSRSTTESIAGRCSLKIMTKIMWNLNISLNKWLYSVGINAARQRRIHTIIRQTNCRNRSEIETLSQPQYKSICGSVKVCGQIGEESEVPQLRSQKNLNCCFFATQITRWSKKKKQNPLCARSERCVWLREKLNR